MTKVKQLKHWGIYKLNKKEVYELYSKYQYAISDPVGEAGWGIHEIEQAYKLFATIDEAIEYIKNWNPKKKRMNIPQTRTEYAKQQLVKKELEEMDRQREEQREKERAEWLAHQEYLSKKAEYNFWMKTHKPSKKKHRPCILNIFNPFFRG